MSIIYCFLNIVQEDGVFDRTSFALFFVASWALILMPVGKALWAKAARHFLAALKLPCFRA